MEHYSFVQFDGTTHRFVLFLAYQNLHYLVVS